MKTVLRVIFALLLGLPALSTAADPDDLVEKTIEAYGGKEALSKAVVVRQRGRIVSVGRGKAAGALTRTFRRPDKLRIEIAWHGDTPEVRILSGPKGWRQGFPVTGAPYDAMVLQAARIALPMNLVEGRRNLRRREDVVRDGKTLGCLELSLGGGMTLAVEIERETGRIVRTVGRSKGTGKRPMPIEFVATYDDFRKVDGILFAFREGNFAMGSHTGDTFLENVEVSGEIDPATFLPAGEGGSK